MNVLSTKSFQITRILSTKYSTQALNEIKEKWDLLSAVSLERPPVITRDLTEFETKIAELLCRVEFEKSHKSNFEKTLEADKKRENDIKDGKLSLKDLDSIPQQTGQDFLDSCQSELKSFEFAERFVDEKTEKDLKSTKRALDRRLLLLVKEKIGNNNLWVLPQGLRKESEKSLRETAERVLKEKCGDGIKAKFLGNAPCGFYKYRYPKCLHKEAVGAKIFFFKAQLQGGQIDEKICKNFHWATRSEMENLQNDYKKCVNLFLIDEEH